MTCEPPTVYIRIKRKARKAHRCCSCNWKSTPTRILPGATYFEHRGLWDGEWATMRRCARCERVADALRREWTSDVYYPEDEIPIADARRYLRERMEARKHCRRRRSQEGNND